MNNLVKDETNIEKLIYFSQNKHISRFKLLDKVCFKKEVSYDKFCFRY